MDKLDYSLSGEDFYNQPAWVKFAKNLKETKLRNIKIRLELCQSEIAVVTEGLLNCAPNLTVEQYIEDSSVFDKNKPIEERLSRILAGLIEEELNLKKLLLSYGK